MDYENEASEPKESKAEDSTDIVTEAKERYELAKVAYSTLRAAAQEDTKFYLGDSENGWQWPENIKLNRSEVERRPCLTINLTAQHCNQVINSIRQNRPAAKVRPVDDSSDKKTAEILEGLIRNIHNYSSADDAHDLAAEHAIAGGEGYWAVRTCYESEKSFNQIIKIDQIPDPNMVYIDPFAKNIDRSDADWGFVFEDVSKEYVRRKWPDINPSSWAEDAQGWTKKDTVRIADYYYCEYVDDVLYQLPTGDSELKSKIPPQILEQLDMMVSAKVLATRPTKRKEWKICKLIGGESKPVDMTDWPGSTLPIVMVVGKELTVNGEVVRKGLVRDLKDPARMVNYAFSAAIESIALQNKIPYMAPAAAIEGYETIWDSANIENRSYLPYNHVDDSGNQIPAPQRQQGTQLASAQIQMLQVATEQMRGASGQHNASMGIKSEASSGIGIQRLKSQSEVATFHFPDNFARALKYEAQILVDLITGGRVMDTKRVMRVLGIDGKESQAVLDPSSQVAHQEVDGLTEEDVTRIFNPTIGRYDVTIDTGPSYMTQRQETAANVTEIAARNPQVMQLAGDLVFRSLDFPLADQFAKRFEKSLPPGLKDEKGQPQIPPQVQQAIQQAQQHIQEQDQVIQQMQSELQKNQTEQQRAALEAQKAQAEAQVAQARLQIDQAKIQIDSFKAETERAKMEYEARIAMAQQTLQESAASEEQDESQQLAFEQYKAELQAETERWKARLDAETKMAIAEMQSRSEVQQEHIRTAPAMMEHAHDMMQNMVVVEGVEDGETGR
jgi:hypothetical protein